MPTNDGSKQAANAWPSPKFYFEVKWGTSVMSFQEVSGLNADVHPMEYRHGDDSRFSTIKMPGLTRYGTVTMKKGLVLADKHFWDWYKQITMNTAKRATVTISLLDKPGMPTMVWTLANAWATKLTCTDPKSTGSEIAIEFMELVHEGLTMANG